MVRRERVSTGSESLRIAVMARPMLRDRIPRMLAAVAALAGLAGLGLQLALIVGNLGPAPGIWRFVGFFTILANGGAAVVASAIVLRPQSALAGTRARLMAAWRSRWSASSIGSPFAGCTR